MRPALRPYFIAATAVLGAGLVAVTPSGAPDAQPHVQRPAVELVVSATPAPTPYTEPSVAILLGDELSHWLYAFAPDFNQLGFTAFAAQMYTWAADLLQPAYQEDLYAYLGPGQSLQLASYLNPASNGFLDFLAAHPIIADALVLQWFGAYLALYQANADLAALLGAGMAPAAAAADLTPEPAVDLINVVDLAGTDIAAAAASVVDLIP